MNELSKQLIFNLYQSLQPYCKAIYLGGSCVYPFIENHTDIDYICFADKKENKNKMKKLLICWLIQNHFNINFHSYYDFSQIRCADNEEHAIGSYINKEMILLAGEPVNFTFDIIDKDRNEYIDTLKSYAVVNTKRYYQLYRGLLILKHNSYDLIEEEKENINILHDQKPESKELIEKIKKEIEELDYNSEIKYI